MDQQGPAAGDPRTPSRPEVVARGAKAVGGVDVEEVDRVVDGGVGRVGEGPRRGAPGRPRRRARGCSNAARSPSASSRTRRSPAARGRCRRGGRWRRTRRRAAAGASTIVERPRKLPISTMRPPAGHGRRRRTGRRPWSSVIQPSTGGEGQCLVGWVIGRTPQAEDHHPGRSEQLQHAVAGEHLLGRRATTVLEHESVAQQGGEHRHDGELVEGPVCGRSLVSNAHWQ